MIMVGFLTTEAAIRIEHFREELVRMEPPTPVLAMAADRKWLLHGEKGRKAAKLTLGLPLDGSSLGALEHSLIHLLI